MLNIGKFIVFIISLLFATVSLAATCTSGEAACELNKKKMQLMNQMGIKAVETKDQPKAEDKKPSKPQPFKIPKPGSSQADADQDTSGQSTKVPVPVYQDYQEPEVASQPQRPLLKPLVIQPISQTQTGIYR